MESEQFLLDTSALLAFLANEEGASMVEKAQPTSSIPFIALTELYYTFWRRWGEMKADHAYGVVKDWNLPLLLPSERVILQAGKFKAEHRLGIADSYIAAFAVVENLTLLTKDLDFKIIDKEISLKFL